MAKAESPKRPYDSPVRRQRVAQTREQIVAAGAELLHGFPIWNWRALTPRSVAEHAGVTERTVYRHFGSERELRDAVMARMEQDAGVELEGLSLDGVTEVAAQILAYVSKFPIEPRMERDATVAEANERQRSALLSAVRDATTGWRSRDALIAAAMLDVLWAPVAFERLVTDWGLDTKEATSGITWAIELIQAALEDGPRPT
ncbi:MAG: TetR/AcrR family transcriptional regulator [Acidimicrobiales bacterium]